MRKLSILIIILFAVLLIALAGCAEKTPERKLTSKPVVARQVTQTTQPAPTQDQGTNMVVETTPEPVQTTTTTTTTSSSSGKASCQQLSSSDLQNAIGGSWTQTSDCPKYPALPGGVSVCQCSYDGPGNLYFNVETQLYEDEAEAIRVFKMYCDDETNELGDMSCRRVRSSSVAPNFVYFLKDTYFVKLSCLGGDCSLDSIAEAGKVVEAEI